MNRNRILLAVAVLSLLFLSACATTQGRIYKPASQTEPVKVSGVTIVPKYELVRSDLSTPLLSNDGSWVQTDELARAFMAKFAADLATKGFKPAPSGGAVVSVKVTYFLGLGKYLRVIATAEVAGKPVLVLMSQGTTGLLMDPTILVEAVSRDLSQKVSENFTLVGS